MNKAEILEFLATAGKFVSKKIWTLTKWIFSWCSQTPKRALWSIILFIGVCFWINPPVITPQNQALLEGTAIMTGLGIWIYLWISKPVKKAKKILGFGKKKKEKK
ncbi:MAG: hypothetical protein Q8P11_03260 [bacterium]|nr:hypothetical protein [bacterium]